jgi:uncharacterized membrane protein YdcZ (DUF606 family)
MPNEQSAVLIGCIVVAMRKINGELPHFKRDYKFAAWLSFIQYRYLSFSLKAIQTP